MSVITEIKKLNEDFIVQKKELMRKTKVLFDVALVEVFNKYPELDSFSWTQYTPYFNDGDSCEFSAHVDYPSINGVCVDDMRDIKKENTTWSGTAGRVTSPNPLYNESKALMVDEIIDILGSVDEAFLQDVYGDHTEVVVGRNGTTTSRYDHD